MNDYGTRHNLEQDGPSDLDIFKAWLVRHEARFRAIGRPTEDIARQAIQDGCSIIAVRQWQATERFKEIPR